LYWYLNYVKDLLTVSWVRLSDIVVTGSEDVNVKTWHDYIS